MKKILVLSLVLIGMCVTWKGYAQEILEIPYDATSLTDEQRNADPVYLIYPLSLEGVDSVTFACDMLTFTVNGVSFTMIDVEGGTFTMGATAEQGTSEPDADEYPTHSVT